jgi:hypothetical protein
MDLEAVRRVEKTLKPRIKRLKQIVKDDPGNTYRAGQLMEAQLALAETLRIRAALEHARNVRMADTYLTHLASSRKKM